MTMTRTIANTYICINAEGQTLSIIARTGNEAHNIAIGFLRKANIVSVRRVFKSGKLGKEILRDNISQLWQDALNIS